MSRIEIIPCLSDNYAYVMIDEQSKTNILIDAPEAGPILKYLKQNSLSLDFILLTHHHPDHIDGVQELRDEFNLKVVGAKRDRNRLPSLDIEVKEGDILKVGSCDFAIIDVDGHTIGHIAYIFEKGKIAFTGDSLMTMGCGRLFEGTPEQMFKSLQKFKKLPGDMKIYSGHEYTKSNIEFALSIDANNEALKNLKINVEDSISKNKPTVPSILKAEYATNPFLRQDDASIVRSLEMVHLNSSERFAKIRSLKDNF
jgi:hydroxyacylglutathione hydrolase